MFKRLLAALFALIAATAFAAVDINKATQAELETVKGIGPAIAGKMLDERKKSPFKDWADMVARVKGVGEGNAAKFSTEGLTVNGQAFNKSAAAPAAAKTADKPAATENKPAAAADKPAKAEDKAAPTKAEEKADKKAAKKAEKAAKAEAAASAAPTAKK